MSEEVRKAKIELQKQLLGLLHKFENDWDVRITGISLDTCQTVRLANPSIISVQLRVEI